MYVIKNDDEKSNILVVDEPTNHLDLESITAFNNGLKTLMERFYLAHMITFCTNGG